MQAREETLGRHEVRLFPSVSISSGREAELRATASLLAIAKAVSEFGRAVVDIAGGPKGRLDCYTEVPFTSDDPDLPELRPDGLMVVKRGKKEVESLCRGEGGGQSPRAGAVRRLPPTS